MGRISASTLAPAYSAHADLLAAAGDGQWLGTIASSVLSELVDEVPGLEEQLAGVSGLQAAEASAVELVGGRPVGTGDFGKVYKGELTAGGCSWGSANLLALVGSPA